MHSEINERLGYSERRGEFSPQIKSNYRTSGSFPYGTAAASPQSDLRTAPRLDTETQPRRKCDGSLADGQNNNTARRLGWGLEEYPLAMMYAPYQVWRHIYALDVALERGTLFGELDLPFEATKSNRGC